MMELRRNGWRGAEKKFAARLAGAGLVILLASYASVAGSREQIHFVAGREMLVENLGAAAFLATAVVYLLMARRAKGRAGRWRRLQLLGLGLFFFLAAGEEASWGQHWLGFETPAELKEINAQEETNLHNLWIFDSYAADESKTKGFEKKKGIAALLLNSNRLFDLIMVGLFWLLPAAASFPTPLRGWLAKLETPVPAGVFAWLLLANLLGTALAEVLLVDGMVRHLAVSEVREWGYAVIGLLAALELQRRSRLDRR